jgi:integrase/recombinase XerD
MVSFIDAHRAICGVEPTCTVLSGIEKFRPHRLRHTFAMKWLEDGGSLASLQELLGHATVTTTQRYARLTDRAVAAEAARVQGRVVEDSANVAG